MTKTEALQNYDSIPSLKDMAARARYLLFSTMSPYCFQMGHSEPTGGSQGAVGVETAAPDTGSPTPSPPPSATPSPPIPQDDDDDERDYQRFVAMNPPPMLQHGSPDCLPIDHNLPQLLRHVSGNADLVTVRDIKLRVISREMSLQRLSFFLPNLRDLNLDGSCLGSLRDLGCGLTSLQILRVCRCGLESLDGTFGLTSLRELYASSNQVDDIGPCSSLPHIRIIDLSKNPVEDISFVEFLNMCPHLEELTLSECPAASKPGYRRTIRRLLPNLAVLDGIPTSDNRDNDGDHDDSSNGGVYRTNISDDWEECGTSELDSSRPRSRGDSLHLHAERLPASPRSPRSGGDCSYESSFTSMHSNSPDVSSSSYQADLSQEFSSFNIGPGCSSAPKPQDGKQISEKTTSKNRPFTTGSAPESSGVTKRRPLRSSTPTKPRPSSASSAPDEGETNVDVGSHRRDSPSALTSGMVVCGNLTMALRSRRRRQDAWAEDSVSCSTSQKGNENDNPTSRGEEKSRQPSEKISPRKDGMEKMDEERENKTDSDSGASDGNDVLDEAKKWREQYSAYRSQNRIRWESEKDDDLAETDVSTHGRKEEKSDHKVTKETKTRDKKPTVTVKKFEGRTQVCCPHLFSRQKPTHDTSYDADTSSGLDLSSEGEKTTSRKKVSRGQNMKRN